MMPSFLRRRSRLSERDLTPDTYLTDGRDLFRVISNFVIGRSVLVWLENCVTLEAHARAARELEAMGIRGVAGSGTRIVSPRSLSSTLAQDPAALR